MTPTEKLPDKKLPFGFWVALVYVGVFVAIAVGDRIESGKWDTGVGILGCVMMVAGLIIFGFIVGLLERAFRKAADLIVLVICLAVFIFADIKGSYLGSHSLFWIFMIAFCLMGLFWELLSILRE
jgi:hypothetical protein